MSEVLNLKNISQFFYQGKNKVNVLNNLDLVLSSSQKIAIIGSSGSGKTSLLNIISLMERPKAGSIFLLGQSVAEASDNDKSDLRKANIGYVHQKNSLLMEFTAFENIYLSLLINNYNRKYAKEKTMYLLEKVKMFHRQSHKPSSLSGGEQQRVAIARAISNDPEIIVADEPTGNLDKKNSNMIIDELCNITEENHSSLILATHDIYVANRMNLILELSNKKLRAFDEK